MNKRRQLKENDEVILIYDIEIGFIQQRANFKEYRRVLYNNIGHDIPVFERHKNEEITGVECFWVLPSDISDDIQIEQLQRELIDLQLRVLEIGFDQNYKVPEKIKDKEIRELAMKNSEQRARLVQHLGYDPLDYSWVEKELAEDSLEKDWFTFQRENKGIISDKWTETVEAFQKKYKKEITIDEAFALTRKWKRYLIGSWNTVASKNANIEDWKRAAKDFEEFHRHIEERMEKWSIDHQGQYPLAKVIEPVRFHHGPYFNACVERIPKLFTNAQCDFIRKGVVLEVISYDIKEKYIRLDFTSDVRQKIKPNVPTNDPWKPLMADYVISVPPINIEVCLELLGPLD